jgi:receptor protein-tyrosine kinase
VTATPKTRAHLVERAVEAMSAGGAMGLGRMTPPAGNDTPATEPPASPAAEPAAAPRMGAPILAEPAPRAAEPRAAEPPSAEQPSAEPERPPIPLPLMQAAGLVALSGKAGRTRLSEEMAVVQQQVLRTMRGLKPEDGRASRVALVTSARPGEGKTFTALNLAAAIATGAGYPTLLVDGDGKRGSISELLGVADAPGLLALARDPSMKVADLLVQTAIPRLSMVPFGIVDSAAAEDGTGVPPGTLLAGAVLRLATLFPKHVIILDSPPCLAASDPGSLAAVAGQVLVVVHAEKTQRNEVEAALDMVESCPVLQLVLNRTQMTTNDSFGAYGYGAYGGYGSAPPSGGR